LLHLVNLFFRNGRFTTSEEQMSKLLPELEIVNLLG
jgi:hypothetical protein